VILVSGDGVLSGFNMGLGIASGLSIRMLFMPFAVPAVYLLIGRSFASG
jgi:hypothetical protein